MILHQYTFELESDFKAPVLPSCQYCCSFQSNVVSLNLLLSVKSACGRSKATGHGISGWMLLFCVTIVVPSFVAMLFFVSQTDWCTPETTVILSVSIFKPRSLRFHFTTTFFFPACASPWCSPWFVPCESSVFFICFPKVIDSN